MLLVASGGCWWQAEVVGGKRRLLVASGGCWWQAGQAEVVESSFVKENNEVSALSHAVWRLSKGFHCSPTGNIDALPKGFDAEFSLKTQRPKKLLASMVRLTCINMSLLLVFKLLCGLMSYSTM